jgi:hypothetical protein
MSSNEPPDELCSVYVLSTEHCRTDEDGSTRCEFVKRVFRQRPGRPTEEVSCEKQCIEKPGLGEASSLPQDAPSDLKRSIARLPPTEALFGGISDVVQEMLNQFHRFGGQIESAAGPPSRPQAASRISELQVKLDEV